MAVRDRRPYRLTALKIPELDQLIVTARDRPCSISIEGNASNHRTMFQRATHGAAGADVDESSGIAVIDQKCFITRPEGDGLNGARQANDRADGVPAIHFPHLSAVEIGIRRTASDKDVPPRATDNQNRRVQTLGHAIVRL